MVISKKFRGCYISCLPSRIQAEMKREIIEALKNDGINKAEIKTLTAEAMASRVADIESLVELDIFRRLEYQRNDDKRGLRKH